MKLGELIEGMKTIKSISGQADVEVSGVGYDSRDISAGDLFAALRGENFDGAIYIDDAIKRGACAIVSEDMRPESLSAQIPFIGVTDARDSLAFISSVFYGHPSTKMEVIGITGTNGKTSCAHLLRDALSAHGHMTGMIGTISYHIGDKVYPAPFTTPEAPEFQSLLLRMFKAGCSHVVTEVSSHALTQRRADHTHFKTAVFTNLTPEHLDFHHSMDDYFKAKSRLFLEMLDGPAIINIDDPYGRELAHLCEQELITYSIGHEADLTASSINNSPGGISFTLTYEGKKHEVNSRLIGRPNVWNILAALGALMSIGMGIKEAIKAISKAEPIEGRFMKVESGQDFLCLIDFAHTGDALRRLIESAREFTPRDKRIITVFGCGGNRDKAKRPIMGAAATELSDMVFITSDNPRGETPEAIIEDITRGAGRDNYKVEPDRAVAIRAAISDARAGDTVLIAGKGHEQYQEFKDKREPFSDLEVALKAISEKGGAL
jgi:UDP-N-acetylmuramoyl-L-alanyl-D-glutamate--2,6-diaminopimelate ligase